MSRLITSAFRSCALAAALAVFSTVSALAQGAAEDAAQGAAEGVAQERRREAGQETRTKGHTVRPNEAEAPILSLALKALPFSAMSAIGQKLPRIESVGRPVLREAPR